MSTEKRPSEVINLGINHDLYRQVKLIAVATDMTMASIIRDAIADRVEVLKNDTEVRQGVANHIAALTELIPLE